MLAVVVDEHAVAAIQRPLGNRVEQTKGRHHGARGQHIDLEVAARHVVDFFGVILGVFVKYVL